MWNQPPTHPHLISWQKHHPNGAIPPGLLLVACRSRTMSPVRCRAHSDAVSGWHGRTIKKTASVSRLDSFSRGFRLFVCLFIYFFWLLLLCQVILGQEKNWKMDPKYDNQYFFDLETWRVFEGMDFSDTWLCTIMYIISYNAYNLKY